jgi:hypothetical protein
MTAAQSPIKTANVRQGGTGKTAVEAPLFLAPPHAENPTECDTLDQPVVLDTPPALRFSAGT